MDPQNTGILIIGTPTKYPQLFAKPPFQAVKTPVKVSGLDFEEGLFWGLQAGVVVVWSDVSCIRFLAVLALVC